MTLSEPFWFEDPVLKGTQWEGYRNRVCRIHGLSPSGPYLRDGPEALVDASIAPLILRLNEAGYPTLFSCSGLEEEHSPYEPINTGYLVIACDIAPLIPFLPDGLAVESWKGNGTLRWSRTSTQDERRTGWESLYAAVGLLHASVEVLT